MQSPEEIARQLAEQLNWNYSLTSAKALLHPDGSHAIHVHSWRDRFHFTIGVTSGLVVYLDGVKRPTLTVQKGTSIEDIAERVKETLIPFAEPFLEQLKRCKRDAECEPLAGVELGLTYAVKDGKLRYHSDTIDVVIAPSGDKVEISLRGPFRLATLVDRVIQQMLPGDK